MVIDTSKLTSGSWKTSVFGFIAAVAGFIALNPAMFAKWPMAVEVAKFIAAGGMAGIGLAAKDGNVTGGSKANPSNDSAVVADTAKPKA